MMFIIVFMAQFCSVFFLVMSSKLLRDDRWQLAMANSWLISATQFVFVLVVANTDQPIPTFLCAAMGGSLACGAAHWLYTKHIMK